MSTASRIRLSGFLFVAICLAAVSAQGAVITFIDDEVGFSAGLPDPISGTEDFSGFFGLLPPGGGPAPCDPLSSGCGPVTGGIAYSNGMSGLFVVDFNFFNFSEALGTADPAEGFSIALVGGGTALGFTLINEDIDFLGDDIEVTIDVFDPDSMSLGSFPITVSFASGAAFVGFHATGGDFIGTIVVSPVATESPLIDDISFNFGLAPATATPEPKSLALVMAIAVLGLAIQRQRRRNGPRAGTRMAESV